MEIQTKRVYEPPSPDDGYRVLVDRLWPRGIAKATLRLDEWAKNVAPSHELRTWWHHRDEEFDEFVRRYHEELKDNPALPELVDQLRGKDTVTLIFSAHDPEKNQAVVLADVLRKRLREST